MAPAAAFALRPHKPQALDWRLVPDAGCILERRQLTKGVMVGQGERPEIRRGQDHPHLCVLAQPGDALLGVFHQFVGKFQPPVFPLALA